MINLNKIRTVSIKNRVSKINITQFSRLSGTKKNNFLQYLVPDILIGKDLKELISRIINAKKCNKSIVFMFGAHVIKCGLSPIVIDLMKRGYITCLSTNGAGLIHDFEISYCGNTSEFVDSSLCTGDFGITRETLENLNKYVNTAAELNKGIGEYCGLQLSKLKYNKHSIFAQAYKLNIPITVHAGIGTDIIYQHSTCDGASWGKSSYIDFLKLTDNLPKLNDGGIVLNFGSAVILPEVFLKAINICRNLGYKIDKFTAANFDMIKQYRPLTNIVSRPTANSGGFSFIGHHELMLPLLYTGIINKS